MASVVTKADLVEAAAKAGNLTKTAAGEAVNAIFDSIVHSVAKGNRVTVVGFGTFLPRKRKARSGRNPANGKEIRISAKTVPAFSAGQGFKEAVADRSGSDSPAKAKAGAAKPAFAALFFCDPSVHLRLRRRRFTQPRVPGRHCKAQS